VCLATRAFQLLRSGEEERWPPLAQAFRAGVQQVRYWLMPVAYQRQTRVRWPLTGACLYARRRHSPWQLHDIGAE